MPSREMDIFVEKVFHASDILSVVSSYVSLKKKGNRYWGCCPFHSEKTPSFSVVPEQGFFYCFGCHAGGNVFKFLSLIENISYFEAIKLQAEKLGIFLPQKEKTREELLRDAKYKELEEVLKYANDFFMKNLREQENHSLVIEYLKKREFTPQIVQEFSLGFAKNSFDSLLDTLKKRGISEQKLLETGLIAKNERGNFYDRFRNRLMIPIYSEKGELVGFGGRILDDHMPKYLNSPETMLFNKRKLLFNLHKALKSIRQEDKVIIVEGYMDAISLYARGVKYVVASLGTAFTLKQCQLLLPYTKNFYFAYDSDEAGQKATLRALDIIKDQKVNVKIITIKNAKDPDEFIRKEGQEAFQKLLARADNSVAYQLKYILKNQKHETLEEKEKILQEIIPILKGISSPLEKHTYISRISQLLTIDEAVLVEEIQKKFPQKYHRYSLVNTKSKNPPLKKDQAQRIAARTIFKLAKQDKVILLHLLATIPLQDFPVAEYKEIFPLLEKKDKTGDLLLDKKIEEELSEEARIELLEALAQEEIESEDMEKVYTKSLNSLKKIYLEAKYEKARLRADTLERQGDSSYLEELQKIITLQKEIAQLKIID